MRFSTLVLSASLAIQVATHASERPYEPFSEYQMPREAEVALARSAAPEKISSHATIKVLTPKGFDVVSKGENGFTCVVLRSWSAAPDPKNAYYAKLRGPICFDPVASRTVLPAEELRTRLGLEGKSPDVIAREVANRYGLGQLPRMEGVSFAYMWSANQDNGPGVGAWHPHMMIYAPYYENSMLGANDGGGHGAPFVLAGGTPYSVVILPMDDKLAIKAIDK